MSEAFDYTDTEPLDYQLVPAGEVAIVQLRIREGGAGEDGVLKRSKKGTSEGLDAEFVLVDGKHAKMKFWMNLLLAGESDGHKAMADKNKALMKAFLDSAYGLASADKSPEARQKRSKRLRDFDGLSFQVRIGIEPGTARPDGGVYKDKNVIDEVITPDKPGYRGPPEQSVPPTGGSGPSSPPVSSAPITKPAWAQ